MRVVRSGHWLRGDNLPSASPGPVASIVEEVVGDGPGGAQAPQRLANQPLGHESPAHSHHGSQRVLEHLSGRLPQATQGVEAGLPELRIVPEVEEMIGLVLRANLPGLEVARPVGPVHVSHESRGRPSSHVL